MYETKKLKEWSEPYWNHIKRNIGLIKIKEQEHLRNTPIVIFGVGGLGGSIVDQLVRSGCEKIVICDNSRFKESNLNRQLCNRDDIGKLKVDVIEHLMKKVNPKIQVKKYYKISEKNISDILESVKVSVLTLDDPITSIIISRECAKKNIPMLESWGIPYLWAWWFTSNSINYEACYGLNTQNMKIEDIRKSRETIINIRKLFLMKLLMFPGIKETYNREEGAIEEIVSGKVRSISLAPIIRITSAYLTFEIFYSGILKIKKMILAPNVIGYDYLRMKEIKFNFSKIS
ncbi:MAG: ThiF family adenylyltransferase [Promethearchaeota archaeon]